MARAFSMKVHSVHRRAGAGLGGAGLGWVGPVLEPRQRGGNHFLRVEMEPIPTADLPRGSFLLELGLQTYAPAAAGKVE